MYKTTDMKSRQAPLHSEGHVRSVVKAISWRIIASLTTFIIAYLITGEWTLSLGIGAIEVVVKLFLNYMHERAWLKIQWGHTDIPDVENKSDESIQST